jgi:hypothetical protein
LASLLLRLRLNRGFSNFRPIQIAMKKSTTKSAKTPAAAPKPAVAVKAMPPAKPPVAKLKVQPAPVATTVPTPAAMKPVEPKRPVTTITALIDVGFGNTLFIRGEGPGLNWEKGTPLEIIGDDKWTIALPESARPIVFKFLLNDVTWSVGDDYTVAPGTSLTITPIF